VAFADTAKATPIAAADSVSHAQEAVLAELIDKYLEAGFKRSPNSATVLGFHQYDSMAPDLSASAIKSEIDELKDFQKKFDELKTDSLSQRSKIDLQLIKSKIKAELLELEDVKNWERNPDFYSSRASSIVYDLISRDFAPLTERMRSVIAREKKIGAMLDAGKANLKNPPRIYTEVAIEQLPGIIDLFKNSVTEKFKSVTDKELKSEFESSNTEVIKQLSEYLQFLKKDLLPKSNGNFALGEDFYKKKLLYEEMEDTPLDQLLSMGQAELKRLQQEFISTAKEIDPTKTPLEVFTAISSDHPSPSSLVGSVSGVLKKLQDFCSEKNIITIPAESNLQVQETPAFMRALTFAAMDAPGPFEQKAKEAYYYVTLPEADWKPERVEEHMRAFCKYDLLNTSVHEAFPGHYVQGLWQRKAPSKIAKIIDCGSNVEGWAHYCEQMMVEQGLENGDKKLKMVMIHDALLRCCRYIVGISMHTKGMSMDEGIKFFVNEGYQEKANAERETKRGTMDPTYLVYTLGKLQIIALRDDYKKLKGAEFSLKDFHNKIMETGAPPIKIIRQIIMGNNTK
jgi:uncharacterized protein (DUF885 family)